MDPEPHLGATVGPHGEVIGLFCLAGVRFGLLELTWIALLMVCLIFAGELRRSETLPDAYSFDR